MNIESVSTIELLLTECTLVGILAQMFHKDMVLYFPGTSEQTSAIVTCVFLS
jgi:hypothetical protein